MGMDLFIFAHRRDTMICFPSTKALKGYILRLCGTSRKFCGEGPVTQEYFSYMASVEEFGTKRTMTAVYMISYVYASTCLG